MEFDNADTMEKAVEFIINELGNVVFEIENVGKSQWDQDKLYVVVYETLSSRYIYIVTERYIANSGAGLVEVSLFSRAYMLSA